MKIAVFGGELKTPFFYNPGLTVHDPLTDELGKNLVQEYLPLIAYRLVENKLAENLDHAERMLEECEVRHIWQRNDWEAQFEELVIDMHQFGDWELTDYIGQKARSAFLGTVFELSPSGKYYQPFACGNLAECPCCGGQGHVPSYRSKPAQNKAAEEIRNTLTRQGATYWLKGFGNWPQWMQDMATKLDDIRADTAELVTCEYCGGSGSDEAYQDESWREALSKALERQHLVLESGEGNPCDIHAVEYRDIDEDEYD